MVDDLQVWSLVDYIQALPVSEQREAIIVLFTMLAGRSRDKALISYYRRLRRLSDFAWGRFVCQKKPPSRR